MKKTKRFSRTRVILLVSLFAALVLLAAAALSAGPAAQAGNGAPVFLPVILKDFPPLATIFGVEVSNMTPAGGLEEIAQAGTYWARKFAVEWPAVEPNKGDRNWAALAGLEEELLNASRHGMQTVLIVRGSPPWAQLFPGVECGPIKQEEFGSFAVFLFDVIKRYSGPPYNIKYWEIWNEPDVAVGSPAPGDNFGCWGNPSDPQYFGGGYYANLLEVLYPLAKAADPDAQILIGGLLMDCHPNAGAACASADGLQSIKFLEGILNHNGQLDGGQYFDGISFHAYDFYKGALGQYHNPNWMSDWGTTGPVVLAKAQYIYEVLLQFQVSGKFLLNTEGALLCGGPFDPPGGLSCSNLASSPFEITKAYYLPQAYAAAISKGLRANFWFTAMGWRNSGLLYDDLSPRPAYTAYAFAVDTIRDAAWLGPITDQDVSSLAGIRGYKFLRDGQQVWLIWSWDGIPRPVTLTPGTPQQVYDALGSPEVPLNPMTVDVTPRYLVWPP